MEKDYCYLAKVVAVYDGDTITVDVDLGFEIAMLKQKLRLYRINAPEVRGSERPEGLVSRDVLIALLLERNVLLVTYKDKKGKFGRWLADIYIEKEWAEDMAATISLPAPVVEDRPGLYMVNRLLVEWGLAEWREY